MFHRPWSMAFSTCATDLLWRHPLSKPRIRRLTNLPFRRGTISVATSVCLVDSLTEALGRGYVQNFGRRICLDPNGFLPQNENPTIPSKYVDVLEEVAIHIRAVLVHRNVRAIFVRGSTVTGNLYGNSRSDLDLIVFTGISVSSEEKRYLRQLLLSKLSNTLHVGTVDIRYLHTEKTRGARPQFHLSPTLRIILYHFAAPIYGSREDVSSNHVPLRPTPHLAIDISTDMNSFRRIMQTGIEQDCFSLQFSAIQWLCKRCLRAVAELAAVKMGAYARDLLPCYQLGSEAYPKFADTILHGLLIACASPENRYLDMRKDDILQTGASIALIFAEIVEELFILQCFGSKPVSCKEPSALVSSEICLPSPEPSDLYDKLKKRLYSSLLLFKRHMPLDNIDFRKRPLPALELKGSRFVKVQVIDLNTEKSGTTVSFDNAFMSVREPVVYRDRLSKQFDGGEVTRDVLKHLIRSVRTVQCRVAPGQNMTFCRSSHQWMEERSFTPPSVLIPVPVLEAVQRLRGCQMLSNLVYEDCDDECVYIQSRAIPGLRVFDSTRMNAWQAVQEERVWISSHGTVSTLHYDASYSALYQRCGRKRLLFFPPCCLPQLGIYPLGHPLHRRGRVDLTRKDTIVFQDFWNECASQAIEVTLRPGDLLLFPPFWSHYTATMTSSTQELSISHTLRYVYK